MIGTIGTAEVISSDLSTIQKSRPTNPNVEVPQGSVLVRIRGASQRGGKTIVLACPFNMNFYKVPLPGEIVLIMHAIDGTAGTFTGDRTYYLNILSSYHSVNSNKFPNHSQITTTNDMLDVGLSVENPTLTRDNNISFQERDIIPIQPYEGDMILQDRHGSAIRFSGTVLPATGYQQRPFWRSDNASDPIVTISCGLKTGGNYYSIENPDDTASSIIMSSKQKINSTTLSQPNIGRTVKSLSRYENSQILLTADRLVFNSKRDEIVLSAKNTVSIATPNWAMDMNELFDILEGMLAELAALTSAQATFVTGVGPTGPATNVANIQGLLSRLRTMKQ
jgi:hypothetical protein